MSIHSQLDTGLSFGWNSLKPEVKGYYVNMWSQVELKLLCALNENICFSMIDNDVCLW